MSPGASLTRAEKTLWLAGVGLVIVLALVREARGDLGRAKTELRVERNARLDLEERVDRLQGDLDGALDHISKLKGDGPEQPPAT